MACLGEVHRHRSGHRDEVGLVVGRHGDLGCQHHLVGCRGSLSVVALQHPREPVAMIRECGSVVFAGAAWRARRDRGRLRAGQLATQLRLLAGSLSHPGLVVPRFLTIQLIQCGADPIPTILAASH